MSTSAFECANKQKNTHIVVILTGPTGAGKDTIMEQYIHKYHGASQLVTTTSRPPRDGEVNGKNYHFISRDTFEDYIQKDLFIEWVEYLGYYKGGQKKHVEEALNSGRDVLWRIDVRGVKNVHEKVRKLFPHTIVVMIVPESIEELEKRIRDRRAHDQISEDVMRRSLTLARWETEQVEDCDYIILNERGKEEEAVDKLHAIIEARRQEVFSF